MLTSASAQKHGRTINGQIQRLWRHPTTDYRMKTWWFFGYEHTTDEGITADAEATSFAPMRFRPRQAVFGASIIGVRND